VGAAGNAYKVLIEKSEGTGYSEDLDVDGKILLKWAIRERWEGEDDSHLILDTVQRWAPANMEMTLAINQLDAQNLVLQ